MAYDVSSLIAAVQDDLKDSSFSSSRILRYLNRGQQVIFNSKFLKFTEKAVSGPLTVGQYTFEQQSDHQATIGGTLVDPDDDRVVFTLDESSYMPHREFFAEYPTPETEDNGTPTAWTEFGDQVFFNRPVDDDYVFSQRYYRWPAELTANADVPTVPEAFRSALELFALYRSEKYRGNHDIAATYKQDFEDELEALAMRFTGPTQVGTGRIRQRRVRISDY